ncbi:unnamed protein product [Ceratitis capitata]|uniref:(Mediterranean fruit fly) hypothetical protein n=1 Tax=Ceratitis capitata TaxID=7213 RepID=A0A811V7A1_CERCA|nr:unnamed protein product [Ceratitis capitata]
MEEETTRKRNLNNNHLITIKLKRSVERKIKEQQKQKAWTRVHTTSIIVHTSLSNTAQGNSLRLRSRAQLPRQGQPFFPMRSRSLALVVVIGLLFLFTTPLYSTLVSSVTSRVAARAAAAATAAMQWNDYNQQISITLGALAMSTNYCNTDFRARRQSTKLPS